MSVSCDYIYFLVVTWNSHINMPLCVKVCLSCSFHLLKLEIKKMEIKKIRKAKPNASSKLETLKHNF